MLKYSDVSKERTLELLKSGFCGLSEEEAARRLKAFGRNELSSSKKISPAALFFSQFGDVMVLLLIAAAAISAVVAYLSGDVGDLTDTFIILAIILLNAVVGAVQQFRADKAIESLKKLSAAKAKVRREGAEYETEAALLVEGDIITLEEGDCVPADCRILQSADLRCDEAALTGESQSVTKREGVVAGKRVTAASAYNLLFSSTFVVAGSCTAVVTATGRNTEMGAIADMLDGVGKSATPLERALNRLGKIISLFVLGVAALIFIVGAFTRNDGLLKNFMTAVAIAVAAIPEGLPAVVSIIMAMGVQRMSSKNVVIRKLKSVETLGGCTCICTDKTGTLTQNKMKVVELYSGLERLSAVDIQGVNPIIWECMSICTHVKGAPGAYLGDPTETALKICADGAGFNLNFSPLGEKPFTSERKMMTVSAECGGVKRAYSKGAPEVIISLCDGISEGGGVRPITEEDKRIILSQNAAMSDGALRVLAFAYKEGGDLSESGLIYLGLAGMSDGLKEGVKEAVEECRRAGISTVMITGDHARTAFAIAKKAGITQDESRVYTGDELDKMTKPQLKEAVREGRVFARVSPKHKNIIVNLKKAGGEVVAMTGDGVNDAPSVKSADIGIAMGRNGTDVTKSVADMVIADDNFTTIVTAVREGRRISSNVRKTIQFFLSTNLAEVLSILFAAIVFFRYDFLYSTQLLWINLITDSFPVLALGVEKGDADAMLRPPERAEKAMFSKSSLFVILSSGLYITAVTVGVYSFALACFGNAVATTMTFLCVSFCELFHAFNVRGGRASAFSKGALSNKVLTATVAIGIAVNVGLCFTPLASAFGICPLTAAQWCIVFGASLSVILFGEAYKFILRARNRAAKPPRLPEKVPA